MRISIMSIYLQIKGDDRTALISNKIGAYPKKLSTMTPVCCGSKIDVSSLPTAPTGNFERHNNVGSFKVI